MVDQEIRVLGDENIIANPKNSQKQYPLTFKAVPNVIVYGRKKADLNFTVPIAEGTNFNFNLERTAIIFSDSFNLEEYSYIMVKNPFEEISDFFYVSSLEELDPTGKEFNEFNDEVVKWLRRLVNIISNRCMIFETTLFKDLNNFPNIKTGQTFIRTEDGWTGITIRDINSELDLIFNKYVEEVNKKIKEHETKMNEHLEQWKEDIKKYAENVKQYEIVRVVTQTGHGFLFDPVMYSISQRKFVKAVFPHGADGIAVRVDDNNFRLVWAGRVEIPTTAKDTQQRDFVLGEYYFLGEGSNGGIQREKPDTYYQHLFQVMYSDELRQNIADILLSVPINQKGKRWDVGEAKTTVNDIEELKMSDFPVGKVVEVLGYYKAGDGADHKRIISETGDTSEVKLSNGLSANIIYDDNKINVLWFGAKGDGISDDNLNINKCVQFCNNKNIDIFFPKGTYIFNISPELDVSNFTGYGIIKTTDKWGHRHDFNIEWCEKGYPYTVKDIINHSLNLKKNCYIGMLGDSITDGAWSDGWVINPTGDDGNLNSTNYDHSKNGGKNSWFVKFTNLLNEIENIFKPCNASLSGAKLIDGWAYRNYDYGFFQNQAYGNKAPEICYLAMGVNDAGQASSEDGFELYRKEFDKFIRKAWGYGSAVTLVSVNKIMPIWLYVENSLKRDLPKFYKGVEYINVFNGLEKITVNGNYSFDELWKKSDESIDTTHPQQIGHDIMGEYMFSHTMSEFMITDNCYIPNTNKIKITGESGKRYEAKIGTVGGIPYLDKFGKYPYINLKENTTLTYYIYNVKSKKSLTVFYLFGNENFGEMIVEITNNGGTYLKYNFGKPKASEYTSYLIPVLPIGLSKVEITFNYKPTETEAALYLPALIIRDFGEKDFINFKGYGFDNVIRPIGYNFGNENFSFLSGKNFLADKVVNSEYPYHITLEIKNYLDNGLFKNGVGVLFFYKEGCGKSILLVYENGFKLYYFDNVTKKKIKLIEEYSLITQREDLILTVSYSTSGIHDFNLKNSTQSQGIQTYEYNITGGRLATYSEVGLVHCYFEYYTSLY